MQIIIGTVFSSIAVLLNLIELSSQMYQPPPSDPNIHEHAFIGPANPEPGVNSVGRNINIIDAGSSPKYNPQLGGMLTAVQQSHEWFLNDNPSAAHQLAVQQGAAYPLANNDNPESRFRYNPNLGGMLTAVQRSHERFLNENPAAAHQPAVQQGAAHQLAAQHVEHQRAPNHYAPNHDPGMLELTLAYPSAVQQGAADPLTAQWEAAQHVQNPHAPNHYAPNHDPSLLELRLAQPSAVQQGAANPLAVHREAAQHVQNPHAPNHYAPNLDPSLLEFTLATRGHQ